MANNQMSEKERKLTATAEENVYAGVYHVLLVGMYISTALFALGIIRAMMHPEFYPLTASWVRDHYHWSLIFHGLVTFDPMTLMMTATLLLILTPVVRVIVSIHAFAVDHDYKFVVVTSIVLVVMILTCLLGLMGLH